MRVSYRTRTIAIIALLLVLPGLDVSGEKVEVSGDGVLVADGTKAFPIGLTLPPAFDAKGPSGKRAYDELRAGGINFIRTGPTAGAAWNEQTLATELKYQEAAAQNGLRCMVYLHELASIDPGQEKREAILRKVIAALKDHPGMGVWKGADEPQWGKMAVPPLVHVKEMLRELDPNHPVWIVQAPRGTVETLRAYDGTYDITGVDV